MAMNRNVHRWVVLLAGLVPSCRLAGPARRDVEPRDSRTEIVAVLHAQAADWNAGDVEAFMRGYWRSPELCFVSSSGVTRGWRATLDRYRRRYPTRDAMGELTFSDLDVRIVARHAALVVGRWRLRREQPVGGWFTLIVRRDGGRWVIVHDHTSQDDP